MSRWPEECIQSERRFGKRIARLYPLVEKRVMTPEGPGVLLNAVVKPMVLLDSEMFRAEHSESPSDILGEGKKPKAHDLEIEAVTPE